MKKTKVSYYIERENNRLAYIKQNDFGFGSIVKVEISKWEYDRATKYL